MPRNTRIRRSRAKTPSFGGLTPATPAASKAMSRNTKTDTRCEVLLRSVLWRRGLRFRKNLAALPGKPDVAFSKQRVAVFCDGDFWHGKHWTARKRKLTRGHNAPYWVAKIAANMRRDRRNRRALEKDGWGVVRLWESDILADPQRAADAVEVALRTKATASGTSGGRK